jgi:ribonuclease Z
MGRTRDLEIIGPKGIVELVTSVNRVVKLYNRFPIRIREVRAGQSVDDVEYTVRVAAGKHGIPCLAYALEEKPRPGRFNVAKAKRLGIPEGPLWKALQSGRSVKVRRHRIASRLVVGPSRRGVKVTYAVDTRPCAQVIKLASGSDLLIHDSCFDESASTKAREYGHSTASEAAQVASAVGVPPRPTATGRDPAVPRATMAAVMMTSCSELTVPWLKGDVGDDVTFEP